MKYLAIGAMLLVASPAMAALTVETTDFIATPTNFNGFEGIGSITGADAVTSYSEDGITVSYVGTGAIWSTSQAFEGQYSWYPDGGGNGYTRITFAATNQIEFVASSGFGESVNLVYEVLLGGVSLGSGLAGAVPAFGDGFSYYGLSGATFDEVRLQAVAGGTTFIPTQFEAGAFDAISLGGVVPEPASWALMIAGFGLVGGMMRRRAMAVTFG